MNSIGLDFLGSRSLRAQLTPQEILSHDFVQSDLPSAILPQKKFETIPVGSASHQHRRGRGLPWPIEAQIPVLGNLENGTGRVPLAAAFEALARAETSWGRITRAKFSWRPDGVRVVEIDAAKLLSAHINDGAGENQAVGVVVPDSLGVAGQEAIISATGGRRLILVPKSIAAAIAWCHDPLQQSLKIGRESIYLGYVTVVDLAIGSWSVSKVPIRREILGAVTHLIPAHFSKFKQTALRTTGWGLLGASHPINFDKVFRREWAENIFHGKHQRDVSPQTNLGIRHSGLSALTSIEGPGDLTEAIRELTTAIQTNHVDEEFGANFGLLIVGPLSRVRLRGEVFGNYLSRQFRQPVLKSGEMAMADGAAWAAAGLLSDSPTWLEMVDQLDLYCIGRSEHGDIESAYKRIIEPKLLKAGSEFHNPEPITGLKLQSGNDCVQITIRRPDTLGKMEFRKVETVPDKRSAEDVPLVVNVTARPGQGFARVRVESIIPGLFDSQLDWQRMEVCPEPEKPKLAYIIRAVELKPAPELWPGCLTALLYLSDALNIGRNSHGIIHASREAKTKFSRSILAKNYATAYRRKIEQDDGFQIYTPMGRFANPPNKDDVKFLDEMASKIGLWLSSNRYDLVASDWLKKLLGSWYLGCPKDIVHQADLAISRTPELCKGSDLQIAGLCFESNEEMHRFYVSYQKTISVTTSPNNWLRALKNIVKFNEHALRDVSDEVAENLFTLTLTKLVVAIEGSRPIISQNCIEALLFCLKRRRYNPSFVASGSHNFRLANHCIDGCKGSPRIMRSTKNRELVVLFGKFLRTEADVSDVGTLLLDDENDASDEGPP